MLKLSSNGWIPAAFALMRNRLYKADNPEGATASPTTSEALLKEGGETMSFMTSGRFAAFNTEKNYLELQEYVSLSYGQNRQAGVYYSHQKGVCFLASAYPEGR